MNRRHVIGGLAAAATLSTFEIFAPNTARAAYSCSRPRPFNGGLVRNCSVGFRIRGFTASQRCDQWCWAACIEAAFKLNGFRVSQEVIVDKLFGAGRPCRPSVGPQIAAAVEGDWVDRDGREFSATTNTHLDVQFGVRDPRALQNVSRYLADEVPVIIGTLGHATLVTSMSWIEDNFGQQKLTEIVVRDPWPGRPNRRRLSAQEFQGATYISAVIVD
ncbi:MAG: hypothetical protein ACI9JL_004346 [Paracoccaceae bacterium]|jgi:hypothetical protein